MKTLTRTALLIQFVLLVALLTVGCSGDKAMSPSFDSTQTNSITSKSTAEIELYGRVQSVDPEARILMIVGDPTVITVAADADVVFKDGSGETPIALSDIQPNDSVEVRGDADGSGGMLADRVRIRPDDSPENEMEFGGRVESIDPMARTMTLIGNATPITVAQNAEIVQKVSGEELAIGLDDIMIGDSVEIRGNLQGNGSLLADRIRLRIGNDFRGEIEFTSTITGIDYDAGTFTVAGHPELITTDANTLIFFKVDFDASAGGALKPLSGGGDDDGDDDQDDDSRMPQYILFTDLKVGDTVEVYADRIDASTLLARAIEVEDGAFEHGLQVEFKDFLATVDSGTRTVTFSNNAWMATVDNNATLLGLNGEALILSDFASGELVEVKGFEQTDGTLNIVSMHKEDNL